MQVNEYQQLAMTTLNPELQKRDVLINSVMGLCGEAFPRSAAGRSIVLAKQKKSSGTAAALFLLCYISFSKMQRCTAKPCAS